MPPKHLPLNDTVSEFPVTGRVATVIRSFAEGVSQITESAHWAVKVAWAGHVALVAGLGFLTLAEGLIPAAMALVARGLINAAVDATRQQIDSLLPLLLWISLGIGVTIVEAGS